ncbi:hypothetical protein EXU57_02350 [Segetibacter sp. 3557_3]|uniref:hypothetical protein n=1 Tax=Segetibacter sp. 3557_3 TaxID=2547429 RepID=UPI00105849C5|nr:hypothetical protein [Segetibacter sp. 3557_3]TDH28935.1 hypothetical protein EXU57_02350 [Segetibacter sp. 3557_3]
MLKLILSTLLISVCSCKQKQDVEYLKRAAYLQMEGKVNDGVVQLKNDCDSNLLSTAKAKADSILASRRNRSIPATK